MRILSWWPRRNSHFSVPPEILGGASIRPQLDLEIYETFRKYVQHEDNLVNQRISWMLIIHGFLYAAFALLLQTKLGIAEKLNSFPAHLGKIKLHHYLRDGVFQTEFGLLLVSAIGLCVSGFAFRSILAARRAAKNVQLVFEGQFRVCVRYQVHQTVATREGLILPTIAGGGNPDNVTHGIFSAMWLPPALMIGWILSLVIDILLLLRLWPINW